MIKYEAKCSSCGRVYPILLVDPSKAPICCHHKMDVEAIEMSEDAVVISLGFYDHS